MSDSLVRPLELVKEVSVWVSVGVDVVFTASLPHRPRVHKNTRLVVVETVPVSYRDTASNSFICNISPLIYNHVHGKFQLNVLGLYTIHVYYDYTAHIGHGFNKCINTLSHSVLVQNTYRPPFCLTLYTADPPGRRDR